MKNIFLLLCNGIVLITFLISLRIIKAAPTNVTENEINEDVDADDDTILLEYARNILKSLDTTIDPCDNFHEYACGNWANENPMPKGYSKLTVFKKIEIKLFEQIRDLLMERPTLEEIDKNIGLVKAKIYFQSCMSRSDGVRPLLDFFDREFGGWPALLSNDDDDGNHDHNSSWNGSNLTDFYNALNTGKSFQSILIDIMQMPDFKNVSQTKIYLDEPKLQLINANYYLDETKSDNVEALRTYISECFEILGLTRANALRRADEIIQIETELAKIMKDPDIGVRDEDEYKEVTIGELMNNSIDFDWIKLISELDDEEHQLEMNDTVIVLSGKFIENFPTVIENFSLENVVNYVCWLIADKVLIRLDKRFDEIYKKFSQKMYGNDENRPHWFDCVTETISVASTSISQMYIKSYYSKSMEDNLKQITELLKSSFKEIIQESDWIDDDTKQFALKKLNYSRIELGYKNNFLDDIPENENDYDFHLDTYFENLLHFKKLKKENDNSTVQNLLETIIDGWDLVLPISVDAFNLKLSNQVIFPAGILQPPIYHQNYPESIKFGVIGSFIGHELTHGYDNVGRRYDHIGNMMDWWNENSSNKFIEKTKCFVEQYNNYTTHGHQVNGETSLGENIADIGGLTQSYRAYQKWLRQNEQQINSDTDSRRNSVKERKLPGVNLTEEQLFFLAYAQSWCSSVTRKAIGIHIDRDRHSPESIRIIGALRNSPEFAKAYNCPIGSYMNPPDKCKIW